MRVFDLAVLNDEASPADLEQEDVQFEALVAHTREVWGIEWNRHSRGKLLSCGQDFRVCLWDVNSPAAPIATLSHFREWPNDGTWMAENEVVTADEAGKLTLFDLRKSTSPAQAFSPRAGPLNCVAAHPSRSTLLAAGGDRNVVLWDTRKTDFPVHTLWAQDLTSQVVRVEFHPTQEQFVASANNDGQVTVWNLAAIGKEQLPDDEVDGPSELMFTHGAHLASVYDIAWNPEPAFDMMLLSTSADSSVQLWQLPLGVLAEDDDELEVENATFLLE